jgi:pyridoxine/pyridoxamine 5'-phosphate oxidase
MLKSFNYWVVVALAGVALSLSIANAGLYFSNRSLQARINARVQYLRQSQSVGNVYQEIAKALANLAVEHGDKEVTALLAQEGFSIAPTPGSNATANSWRKP